MTLRGRRRSKCRLCSWQILCSAAMVERSTEVMRAATRRRTSQTNFGRGWWSPAASASEARPGGGTEAAAGSHQPAEPRSGLCFQLSLWSRRRPSFGSVELK